MIDYSQHPYKRLLEFIDTGCQKINEERDFVSHLLSMEQANSIEELVRILNVTFKVLAVIHFGSIKLPSNWYKYLSWENEDKYYVKDLFSFFNKKLLKWYVNLERYPSLDQRAFCIANLRDEYNQYEIVQAIMGVRGFDFPYSIIELNRERNSFFSLINDLEGYTTNNYKYNEVWAKYKTATKVLAGNGRIFDIIDEENLKKHAIDAEKLRLKYKQELEERRRQEKERRKQEIKRKRIKNSISTIKLIDNVGKGIGLVLGNLFLGFIGALFSGLRKGKF